MPAEKNDEAMLVPAQDKSNRGDGRNPDYLFAVRNPDILNLSGMFEEPAAFG
jgi:hypothetical protein